MDIVKELIKVANVLDEKGLQKEADELDSIIKEACECSHMIDEAHPKHTCTCNEVVETIKEQQEVDWAVAEKQPTGKQGSFRRSNMTLPPVCTVCNGEGVSEGKVCPRCQGTGHSFAEKEGNVKGNIVVAEKDIPYPMYGPTQIQTRYCPDHPGVMVMQVGDRKVQCPLDGKIYDYAEGFKYQGGKEMVGGALSEQTPQDPTYYQAPHPLFGKE